MPRVESFVSLDSDNMIPRKLLLLSIVALSGACTDSRIHAEVIQLSAIEDVQLVTLESVAGSGTMRVVEVLSSGRTLPVVECRPRKSDIDVIVETSSGARAVAWGGKYNLVRRKANASDPEKLVTITCSGLLTKISS